MKQHNFNQQMFITFYFFVMLLLGLMSNFAGLMCLGVPFSFSWYMMAYYDFRDSKVR